MIARRLVRQDDLRVIEQCPCYGHSLFFASRQLVQYLVRIVFHAYGFKHGLYPFVDDFAAFPSCGPQDEGQIVVD